MMRKVNMGLLALVAVAALVQASMAVTYQVGDAGGWFRPSGNSSLYSNWAANKNFMVGDVLVFNFVTGAHDVAEVSKSAFDSCTGTTPISLQNSSPANFTLASAGEHYYLCTAGDHCNSGMKLAVNVTGTSSPAPQPSSPSPTPAPVPTPPMAPPPSSGAPVPTPSMAPPPSSGSPSPPSPSPVPTTTPPSPTPPSTATPPSPTPPSTATPPTSSGNTPPSTATPPSTTTPPPPPPPPPSSATSLGAAGLAATILSIAVTFMF